MKEQPTLTTERLILRPYSLSDAKELQRLIGDRNVSDTMQCRSPSLYWTAWLKNG